MFPMMHTIFSGTNLVVEQLIWYLKNVLMMEKNTVPDSKGKEERVR